MVKKQMATRKKKINSKKKGNRAERQVAKIFSDWWGVEFARTPQSGGFRNKQFREDWNAEGDLVVSDPSFPFSVECKHNEGWTLDKLLTSEKNAIWEWWAQAKRQCGGLKHPLLVFKRNNQPWLFMSYLSIFNKPSFKYLRCKDPQGQEVLVALLNDFIQISPDVWKEPNVT